MEETLGTESEMGIDREGSNEVFVLGLAPSAIEYMPTCAKEKRQKNKCNTVLYELLIGNHSSA